MMNPKKEGNGLDQKEIALAASPPKFQTANVYENNQNDFLQVYQALQDPDTNRRMNREMSQTNIAFAVHNSLLSDSRHSAADLQQN